MTRQVSRMHLTLQPVTHGLNYNYGNILLYYYYSLVAVTTTTGTYYTEPCIILMLIQSLKSPSY